MNEEMINIEQLDTADESIKDYVDGRTQPSSAPRSTSLNHIRAVTEQSDTQIYVELEVDSTYGSGKDTHLYLKCYKGDILESDTLQFARWKAVRIHAVKNAPHDWTIKKKKLGWIVPHAYNYVNLYKVYNSDKSNDTYDYWEILPKSRDGVPTDWEEFIYEFLVWRNEHIGPGSEKSCVNTLMNNDLSRFPMNYAQFIGKWCGLAVVRDGALITPYKRWQIGGPKQTLYCVAGGTICSTYNRNGWYLEEPGEYYFHIKI